MNSEIESTEEDLLPSLPFCVLVLDFVDEPESLPVDVFDMIIERISSPKANLELKGNIEFSTGRRNAEHRYHHRIALEHTQKTTVAF